MAWSSSEMVNLRYHLISQKKRMWLIVLKLNESHRFLVRLRNDEDEKEINLANNEADSEFAEWKWAKPEEVIEQAVDYKRPTYEEVIKTFGSILNDTGRASKCKSAKW